MFVLCFFLVFVKHTSGQLSISADAYKLFTDKSSTLKLGYVGYSGNLASHIIVQKLPCKKNLNYAKVGIHSFVIGRELNEVEEKLAIKRKW